MKNKDDILMEQIYNKFCANEPLVEGKGRRFAAGLVGGAASAGDYLKNIGKSLIGKKSTVDPTESYYGAKIKYLSGRLLPKIEDIENDINMSMPSDWSTKYPEIRKGINDLKNAINNIGAPSSALTPPPRATAPATTTTPTPAPTPSPAPTGTAPAGKKYASVSDFNSKINVGDRIKITGGKVQPGATGTLARKAGSNNFALVRLSRSGKTVQVYYNNIDKR